MSSPPGPVDTQAPDLGKLPERAGDREGIHVFRAQILPEPPLRASPILKGQTCLRSRSIFPSREFFDPSFCYVLGDCFSHTLLIGCIGYSDAVPLCSAKQSNHIDPVPDVPRVGVVDSAIISDCVD